MHDFTNVFTEAYTEKNPRSFGEKNSKLKPDPKKLKPKSKKTQKAPTPVEMSCQKNVQKKALVYYYESPYT